MAGTSKDDKIEITVEVHNGDYNGTANRVCRPSLSQVRTMIEFMKKHPDLANNREKCGKSFYKYKRLWIELSNIINAMEGAMKSTKGWRKFWSDKKRSILLKQKQIKEGKLNGCLSNIELKILEVGDCQLVTRQSRKAKENTCNGDATDNEDLSTTDKDDDEDDFENIARIESNERHLKIMDHLVDVMGQQAASLLQVAQAQLDNSKSMEQLAEASHIQALAVDRIASTFESIDTSMHSLKKSVLGIDCTMKRDSPRVQTRQPADFFS